MKFLSFILALAFPILSLAQNVVISYPPEGQLIVPGEDFIVQVSLPVRPCYPISMYSMSDVCHTGLSHWLNPSLCGYRSCFLRQCALQIPC